MSKLPPMPVSPSLQRAKLIELIEIEKEIVRRKAIGDFYTFVRFMWSVIEPTTPFVDGWHIRAICQHLEAVKDFKISKLIINMPPRHMKSILVSVMFPAWVWIRNPERRFIYCSYSEALAVRDSLKTRLLIESEVYQELVLQCAKSYGVKRWYLRDDSNQKKLFENTATGARLSVGVGGGLTGQGGDYLFVDDPLNALEVTSDAALEEVNTWHDLAFSTRYNDPKRHAKIIVMQRLHEKDLTGHVMEKKSGEYERLILPARFNPDVEEGLKSKTVLNWQDPRQEKGELLWPSRFDDNALKDLEDDLNRFTDSADAQLQQDPKPRKGGLFPRDNWIMNRASPDYVIDVVQFWDCAQKPGITNDYSVCSTWAVTPNGYFILNVLREKTTAPILEALAISQYEDFKPSAVVIEDKSAGSSLIQKLQSDTSIPVIPFNPTKDKEVRATGAAPTQHAKKIELPLGAEWVKEFIKEHEKFPKSQHDDQVDTTSMAVEYFRKFSGKGPRVRSF